MEPILITETYDCPGITLDQENNIFQITGRSLPEDVYTFYDPIIVWNMQNNQIRKLYLISSLSISILPPPRLSLIY